MSFQNVIASLGMLIGLVFMLLALQPTTHVMFLLVGAFLLTAGFCKVLRIHRPKF